MTPCLNLKPAQEHALTTLIDEVEAAGGLVEALEKPIGDNAKPVPTVTVLLPSGASCTVQRPTFTQCARDLRVWVSETLSLEN